MVKAGEGRGGEVTISPPISRRCGWYNNIPFQGKIELDSLSKESHLQHISPSGSRIYFITPEGGCIDDIYPPPSKHVDINVTSPHFLSSGYLTDKTLSRAPLRFQLRLSPPLPAGNVPHHKPEDLLQSRPLSPPRTSDFHVDGEKGWSRDKKHCCYEQADVSSD